MKSEKILAWPPLVLSQEQREFYFESGHCTWMWQVPRSTGQGLLPQSFCISAIRGGQMCESGYLLFEEFVSRDWLDRPWEVGCEFIERSRCLAVGAAVFAGVTRRPDDTRAAGALGAVRCGCLPATAGSQYSAWREDIQLAESGTRGLSDCPSRRWRQLRLNP
jgi:hypothetical protein